MGAGPLTGWGRGWCRGAREPEPGTAAFGGWGRGRGWRHRFWATGSPGWLRGGWGQGSRLYPRAAVEDERHALESEARQLESDLERIRSRLDELQTTGNQ